MDKNEKLKVSQENNCADIYVLPNSGAFSIEEEKIFRKSFFGGYDKSEVEAYVKQLKDYGNLLNEQLVKMTATTDAMKEEKELLKHSISQKEELIENLLKKADEAEQLAEKNAGLQDVLAELSQQIIAFENEKDETAEEMGKLKAQVEHLSEAESKLEESRSDNDKLKVLLEQMKQEARAAAEQQAALKADIAYLRELNQRQSYDFAIKQERLETQMVENRSDYIKRLQMYAYHIKRSEEALKILNDEISKAEYSLRREESIDTY